MANIYYLNAGDFSREGPHLAANIGGISFILFHSQKCKHCMDFLPEFKRLPGSIRGINFGICSVDNQNSSLVAMSRDSTTPIQSVPKFILYNDGLPSVEYSGQRNRQAVLNFLQEMITRLDQKQSFTRPRRSRTDAPMTQATQMATGTPQLQAPMRQGPVASSNDNGDGGGNSYKITPSTGVKEYDTSYGRPYNTLNESDFLEMENAYKQQMNKK